MQLSDLRLNEVSQYFLKIYSRYYDEKEEEVCIRIKENRCNMFISQTQRIYLIFNAESFVDSGGKFCKTFGQFGEIKHEYI